MSMSAAGEAGGSTPPGDAGDQGSSSGNRGPDAQAGDGKPETAGAGGTADADFFADLRRRAADVEAEERLRQQRIATNWKEARVMAGPIVAASDWVRRVTLLGDDLFVGTASSGVFRYRLGENEPRQRLQVAGDVARAVRADHPGGVDPETSITSLAWDGRWLAAGLAGGGVHVWDADGVSVMELPGSSQQPCYVTLIEGELVAASGAVLRRWQPTPRGPAPPEHAFLPTPFEALLPCRAHSLSTSPCGRPLVGLASGCIELYDGKLERISQHQAHSAALSAMCTDDEGCIYTGSAGGEIARWELGSDGSWHEAWRNQVETSARVVSLAMGGGGVLVSGILDGTVRSWRAGTGKGGFVMSGHKVWLGSISMEPDKSIMVTDGRDNAVYLYNFEAPGEVGT